MKKYSANYSYSNHNFVIQNLKEGKTNEKYLPAISILKNILQRGKPTLLSSFLQEKLGKLHKQEYFYKAYPLIDKETPIWSRIIRGDEKGNYYPAKKFFEELIPKYLDEYRFIQQLIIPEISINEITMVEVDEFANQQVDFFLPQAYLIIEIDGSHHEKEKDDIRDKHTEKYGIKTIRISTLELEQENTDFLIKIEEIKNRIKRIIASEISRKRNNNTHISILDYQIAFNSKIDFSNPNYIATAIVRFQLLILELLENKQLKFNNEWKIEIIERDVKNFAELGIEDLFIWFEHIFKLQKISFKRPIISITRHKSIQNFSNDNSIKIDFSLSKRYTDEFQVFQEIVFVRNDYLDEYLYFKKGDSRGNLKFSSFKSYDYFKISTAKTIKYNLKFGGKNSDEDSLLFFLWNVFLQNNENLDFKSLKFREGQLPIIANALIKNDTIGLLPTGSGKSVCYQLAATLQPAISFVVCPIKSLMYDQKADLDSAFFTRTNHITSDDDSEDKEIIQNEFGSGKYFFIFISPERFQLKAFREYFSLVNKEFSFAYAVIDEVHCLSEWGHDFRTSYLNLSSTIKTYCSNFNWLGLTATASINVLKDIQIEFDIKQENVKTPVNYSREELEFIVIDDENNKSRVIIKQLENLKEEIGILESIETETKCGIIFTPTVNGKNGCYPLSKKLSEYFQNDIRYYSGSTPKINRQAITSEKNFDNYKKEVQKDFKENKFSLLVATKAFGMGVNKGNIHYTFHYGIPGSMEALYQEAGRAGREKLRFQNKKAKCFVLLSKSNDNNVLSEIWDRKTTLSEINKLQKRIRGDINTNLFLFALGLDIIKDEYKIIKNLYKQFAEPTKKNIFIRGEALGCKKAQTEKAIYRLKQLGIIEDWTISSFFGGGAFEVDFMDFNEETIKESLFNTIRKYDSEFSISKIINSEKEQHKVYKKILNAEDYEKIDKYILILLQWSYDNFAYNRRQSLKNIYENSCNFADGKISSDEFKTILENYFKFTQSSYILQHIAENPNDFNKWFDVFNKIDDKSNKITDNFIDRRNQESLRDNLSRFLESYMYNTGLDLISGLVRLLLNDFNNSDGKVRFESSIEQIKNYTSDEQNIIINQILKVGKNLNEMNKNYLIQSLYKFYPTKEFLIVASKSLNDSFSTKIILKSEIDRLSKINEKLYGRFREIR